MVQPAQPEVELQPASLSTRASLIVVDYLLMLLPMVVLGWLVDLDRFPALVIIGLYFTALEGVWGTTPGKKWGKVRVVLKSGPLGVLSADPPGVLRAATRAVVFFGVPVVVGDVVGLLPIAEFLGLPDAGFWEDGLTGLLTLLTLFGTARQRNGFAGLHDLVSGTRVVRVQAAHLESPFPQA